MCGIVGYIGHRNAYQIIINGLHRLEYRGYDSAGVALLNGSNLNIYKKAGKVSELENFAENFDKSGTIGMGHTRWATHGPPNDVNSHPHLSGDGQLAIIHNGIIENYSALKEELKSRGHVFLSDTDTEVLIHLIENVKKEANLTLNEAVQLALKEVIGAYAIVIIDKNNPDEIIAARKGSPMVIGIGEGEYFIASDATPIVEYTKNVIYLNDNEIAYIKRDGLIITNNENEVVGFEKFDMRRQESSGTNKVFNISGPVFDVLKDGGVLIIDELDASLHPLVTLMITKLFNSSEFNKTNAQLIFATHDTNLFEYGHYRRDQIYFVEKDVYGASDLYSLVEYKEDGGKKIRKDRSFEKDYIQGRYGAIPFIGNLHKLLN